MDDDELRELKDVAKRNRTTVAEWVRQVLRAAFRQEPRIDAERKLKVIRMAITNSFPSGDVQQMLEEIERGYLMDDNG